MMVTDHIRSLHKHVNPAKPKDDLDKLLAKYRGSEYVMYQAACEKYGEAPDSMQKIIEMFLATQSLAEQQPVSTVEDDTLKSFGGVSVGFTPLEAPSHKLETLFAGDKKRNFITYVDPLTFAAEEVHDSRNPGRQVVRANCKFDPVSTFIKFPMSWIDHKKSCTARRAGTGEWETIEDHVDMSSTSTFEKGKYDRCVIFALYPEISEAGTTYFCSSLDLDDCKVVTMDAKRRKSYADGLGEIDKIDEITMACLAPKAARSNCHFGTSKLLCCIVSLCGTANAAHLAAAFDSSEVVTSTTWDSSVREDISRADPDLIIVAGVDGKYADVHNDLMATSGYGSTVVVLGNRRVCNNEEATSDLNTFFAAHGGENDSHFPEVLEDNALNARMNRVAAAAFPADAREEPSPVFDEVSGPQDVAEEISGDKDDLDQYLLDALPLPSEPRLEGERRRAWSKIPLRVRTAIRRLHRQFGHVPNKVLIQLMRLSRKDGPCVHRGGQKP